MTTEAKLLPSPPTQNWPPDSRLPPNANPTRSHHRYHHSFICTSCYHSRHRQNIMFIFPHITNFAIVQKRVTDIGCYVRNICCFILMNIFICLWNMSSFSRGPIAITMVYSFDILLQCHSPNTFLHNVFIAWNMYAIPTNHTQNTLRQEM
jgi:hypothetical protein